MSDVFTLSDAAKAIATGNLSPVELTRSCLDRIGRLDGTLRAFLHVDENGAMRSARSAADEVARGEPRSPLHGVPVAVKDLIDVAGMPTTAASKVPTGDGSADAAVVAKLRRAGAVFVGKTNCDEFALGVVSEPTRNPWDPARIPGGSSGGSAVAVAAGMAIAAVGTDTAGSIRIPAALCGVTGLKPRAGALPAAGVMALAPSLDSTGPIAHRVADVALVWGCMVPEGSGGASLSSLSIGIVAPEALGEVDTCVAAAYSEAVAALADLGPVSTVGVPAFSEFRRPNGIVLLTEALEVHRSRGWWPEREHLYSANVAANLRYAATVDEATLASERARLGQLCARFMDAISGVDVVVVPTTPAPAPLASEVSADARERLAITTGLSRLTGPINALPLAAVTVPWSLCAGLPVGVDVIARDGSPALEVAARIESFAPGTGIPEFADA